MKAFSDRNPIAIAVGGITVTVLLLVAAFFYDDLPLVGDGGTSYAANFGDASNLKPGDDVRIAGVRVGEVDSVGLVRAHVRVEFTVEDAWVGDRSSANIKIRTLLGQEYLEIVPEGEHALAEDGLIPEARTRTPLDVADALGGLSDRAGAIDTTQLARSFDVLSETFRNTPAAARTALQGLSRLSDTIAKRDGALKQLAANTNAVTRSLAQSDASVDALIRDGNLLLQELNARSEAITGLLDGTRQLAVQLRGLVRDNEASIGPALTQLSRVTEVLARNRANLTAALRRIGPYYALLADATGSGPWVDVYICGLFAADGDPQVNANARRNCRPQAGR
ncbi:Mce/MlaD family protein [Jatrophihabitans fulvus]